MSVEAMTWAFAQPIPPAPKIVLLALANSANKHGACWPGLDLIVEAVKPMKLRTVQNHLQWLKEQQLITVQARYSDRSGVQLSNLYVLALATTYRGEGAESCTLEDAGSCRVRVQELLQGEGARAAAPPDKNLEPSVEPSGGDAPALLGIDPGKPSRGPETIRSRAKTILAYLNQKADKHFEVLKPNGEPSENLGRIEARIREGFTDEQLRSVVDWKVAQWKGRADRDGKSLDALLRPSTLFGRQRFEEYLGEVNTGTLRSRDLPVCKWEVPTAENRFKYVKCGAPIATAQNGPPKPFCPEHLSAYWARERRRLALLGEPSAAVGASA